MTGGGGAAAVSWASPVIDPGGLFLLWQRVQVAVASRVVVMRLRRACWTLSWGFLLWLCLWASLHRHRRRRTRTRMRRICTVAEPEQRHAQVPLVYLDTMPRGAASRPPSPSCRAYDPTREVRSPSQAGGRLVRPQHPASLALHGLQAPTPSASSRVPSHAEPFLFCLFCHSTGAALRVVLECQHRHPNIGFTSPLQTSPVNTHPAARSSPLLPPTFACAHFLGSPRWLLSLALRCVVPFTLLSCRWLPLRSPPALFSTRYPKYLDSKLKSHPPPWNYQYHVSS